MSENSPKKCSSTNSYLELLETYHAQKQHPNLELNCKCKMNHIVHNLGGINSVIELCLTNQEYCKKHNINLDELRQILLPKHNDINDADHNKLKTIASTDVQRKEKRNDKNQSSVANIALPATCNKEEKSGSAALMMSMVQQDGSIKTNIITDNRSLETVNRQTFLVTDFFRLKTTFGVHGKNNVCFKYLPRPIASFIYHKIVTNKAFALSVTALCIILFLIAQIFGIMANGINIDEDEDDEASTQYQRKIQLETIGKSFYIAEHGIATFCILLCYINSNVFICQIIYTSFDFWYKLLNLVLGYVSWYQIEISSDIESFGLINKKFATIFIMFCNCVVLFFACMLDAFPLAQKTQQIVTTGIAFVFAWFTFKYFLNINEDDYDWNPFNGSKYSDTIGKYTNINFKSMFLSSHVNLILFTLKPVLSIIGNKIRRAVCHCSCKNKDKVNTSSNNDSGRNITADQNVKINKSVNVYKRVHFKWGDTVGDLVHKVEQQHTMSRILSVSSNNRAYACDQSVL